jgi:hypothetical protein
MKTSQTASNVVNIEGTETEHNEVSSEILVRVIEGVQTIVWILGAASENQSFDHRFRPSEDIKKKYQVKWGTSSPGSYSLPVIMGDATEESQKLYNIFSALSSENLNEINELLPDSQLRSKLLKTLVELSFLQPGNVLVSQTDYQ